ncbi:MAG TPA: hypothetical protein VLI70_03095, partial [Micrococcaceae bacterium]|nr:hypothetical protein [Micrococcaceae bacterium]
AGNQAEYLPPQEPELQQAGNQADDQSATQPQHQEASNLEPSKSARAPEQAEPEGREPGFHQPVQEPAAAPELSQYLGTAAAAGGVGSAATALPAEGQTAWSTPPEAAQHGEHLHTGAAQLPDADSASYFDRGEETLLHPAIHDEAEHRAGAGHGDHTPTAHDARPAGQAPAAETGYAAGQAARQTASQPPTAIHETVRRQPESIGATVDPATRQQQPTGFGHEEADRPVYDAFWFAVDRPRAVVDEKTGGFLYNLEPGNWILALQDRGHDFLVQNTDGRVGVLRDLSNIERAPEGE